MRLKEFFVLLAFFMLFGSTLFGQVRTVSLEWDPNTEQDLAGYNVYRSETAGGTAYTKINAAAINGTTYDDTAAQVGRTYYYVATAFNTTGLESGYSNEVVYFVPNPNAPAPPTGLTVSGLGPVALIEWNNMLGAQKYAVSFMRMQLDRKTGGYTPLGPWKAAGETTESRFMHSLNQARVYSVTAVYEGHSDSALTEAYDPRREQY